MNHKTFIIFRNKSGVEKVTSLTIVTIVKLLHEVLTEHLYSYSKSHSPISGRVTFETSPETKITHQGRTGDR